MPAPSPQDLLFEHPKVTLTVGAVAGLAFLGWFLHRNDPPPSLPSSEPMTDRVYDALLGARALVAPETLSAGDRTERALSALRESIAAPRAPQPLEKWLTPALFGASLGAGVALGLDQAVRDRSGHSLLEYAQSALRSASKREE